jgi:hypothetical protein
MINDISIVAGAILILVFVALLSFVFSSKFRHLVIHHIYDWTAKKIAKIVIVVFALFIIGLVASYYR